MRRPRLRPHTEAGKYWGANTRFASLHIWTGTYARVTICWRLLRLSRCWNYGEAE